MKFIFENHPWHKALYIFVISDISACDWCGGRDGGCNSLECYTYDSPWHHFLCSSAVFLRDVTRCETPGMYKWVPGLSVPGLSTCTGGQCRLASIYTAINQTPEILQTVLWNFSLLTLGDWKLWPLRIGWPLRQMEMATGQLPLHFSTRGINVSTMVQGPFLSCSWHISSHIVSTLLIIFLKMFHHVGTNIEGK